MVRTGSAVSHCKPGFDGDRLVFWAVMGMGGCHAWQSFLRNEAIPKRMTKVVGDVPFYYMY